MTTGLVELGALGDWNDILYLSSGFALGAAIFGYSVVPGFVRLAFFLVSFIFLSTTSTSYFAIIQGSLAVADSAEMSGWLKQLTAFGQTEFIFFATGFGVAILFSLSAYLTLLLATWVSGLILPRNVYPDTAANGREQTDSLFNLVVLTCLAIFFSTDLPITYFAHLDLHKTSQAISSASFLSKLISLGTECLFLSAVLVLPLFIASLAVDLFSLLINRYFKEFLSNSTIHSIKLPILVAGLAIMLIPFSEQIVEIMSSSISENTLKGVFR